MGAKRVPSSAKRAGAKKADGKKAGAAGPARPGPRALLTEEVGTRVMRVRRALFARAARALELHGFSIFTYRILACLASCGPSTQQAIADYVGQDRAGVSRQLESLEGSRLVRRRPGALDRRKRDVELTAKGRAAFDRMRPLVQEAVAGAMEPLRMGELRTLCRLLGALEAGATESTAVTA